MTDKMRESFEKHAYCWAASFTRSEEEYCDDEVNSAWLYFKAGAAWQAAQSAAVPVVGDVDCYDAGLLSDFGGGNVEWWRDYIRAELARAHEFYASQMPTTSITAAVPVVGEPWRWIVNKSNGEPLLSLLTCDEVKRYLTDGFVVFPVYRQPTTSISAAELDALRKDAAAGRVFREQLPNTYIQFLPEIDAAIAGEKNHG